MGAKMNENDIEVQKEYWSTRLGLRVTVTRKPSGGYVMVKDDQDNQYHIHVSTLQTLDWGIDEILRNEG